MHLELLDEFRVILFEIHNASRFPRYRSLHLTSVAMPEYPLEGIQVQPRQSLFLSVLTVSVSLACLQLSVLAQPR